MPELLQLVSVCVPRFPSPSSLSLLFLLNPSALSLFFSYTKLSSTSFAALLHFCFPLYGLFLIFLTRFMLCLLLLFCCCFCCSQVWCNCTFVCCLFCLVVIVVVLLMSCSCCLARSSSNIFLILHPCVCECAFVYVSVWSPARTPLYLCIRLSLFLPTSHIHVFMCVCLCLSVCVCSRGWNSSSTARRQRRVYFTLFSSSSPCCCCCLCRTPSLSLYNSYLPLALQFRQIVSMFEKGGKQQCCQIVQPFALEAHEKKASINHSKRHNSMCT